MRLMTNDELVGVAGGDDVQTVEIVGHRMTEEEKAEYDAEISAYDEFIDWAPVCF